MIPAYDTTLDGQPAPRADYDPTRGGGDQSGDKAYNMGGSRGSIAGGDTSAKTEMGGGGGGSGGGGYSLGASMASGPLQATTGLSGEINNDNRSTINFGNKAFSPFGGTAGGGTSGAGLSTAALLGIGAALAAVAVLVVVLRK